MSQFQITLEQLTMAEEKKKIFKWYMGSCSLGESFGLSSSP